jgi:hypothetical protein
MGQKNPTGGVTERIDDLLGEAIDAVPDCKKAGLTPKQVAQRVKKS